MGAEVVTDIRIVALRHDWPQDRRIQAGSLYRFGPSCYSLSHA
jgi:DNA processing protein